MEKPEIRWIKLMDFGERMGCHQMPERSFFYKGYQFPVCARCTGVILGELITLILLLCSVKIDFTVAVALLIPMGIDWGLQFLKILESNNIKRLITGTLGGFGLTYIYYYLIVFVIKLIW
jgi:uncharacterized membrane protein